VLTGNEHVCNAAACVRSEQRKVFNDAPVEHFLGLSYGNDDSDRAKIDAKDDSAQRKAEEAAEEAEDGCDT